MTLRNIRLSVRPLAGLILTTALLAACVPAAGQPTPTQTLTPTPTSEPSLAAPAATIANSPAATIPSETSLPEPTAGPKDAGGIRPALDSDPDLSPASLARRLLAHKLKVSAGSVKVVSEGPVTQDPVPCTLSAGDYRGIDPAAMTGPRQQVILEHENATYEYWVFTTEPELPVALLCSR